MKREKIMNQQLGRPVEILLAEDNPGDVVLTQEAFQDSKIINNLHVVHDGEEAIGFLRRQGKYASANRPDLILLDLNMPKKDGREVLAEIKSDESLKKIPVVVMTSSKAESDVVQTYNLHVNSYIVKPLNLERFAAVVETIEDFWFSIVVLPTHKE